MISRKRTVDQVCLVPGCRQDASRRGLCPGCYASAYRMKEAGEITFDQLVDKGLMKPAHPRRNKLAEALEVATVVQ